MALLSRYRRFWTFGFVAVLLLPLCGLVLPDLPAPPAQVDKLPPAFWQRATERVDPFLNSVFGFRGVVMAAHALIAKGAKQQGDVLYGEDGQLFFAGEQAIEKSLGHIVRIGRPLDELERVARAMADTQTAHGGRFLVVIPPDGATIQSDRLPEWLRLQRRHPTMYDLVATRLSNARIGVLDLRPKLSEAKRSGPVYRTTDSHWNNRGALLAFNAALDALGRADLALSPAEQLGPLAPVSSGDLARLAGRQPAYDEEDYPLPRADEALASSRVTADQKSSAKTESGLTPYAFATNHSGPGILIVGDSFTWTQWRGLMAQKFSRFAWIHHRGCRFEWASIEKFRPDVLVLEMTERYLGCEGLPRGFPNRATERAP